MKLSSFKSNGVSKILSFKDGEVTSDSNKKINGDIEFYELGIEKLIDINEKVVSKINPNIEDERFAFMLLPEICNVEIDITYEQFAEMIETPSRQFVKFMELALNAIADIFDTADSVKNINEYVDKMSKLEVETPRELTKEEKLENLYNELDKATDKETKRELIKQISILDNEE